MTDVDVALGDLRDRGAERLRVAQERKDKVAAVVGRVAASHAVSVDAITKNHVANRKHHVVMARAHAAHALRSLKFSYPQVARALGMSHHSQAMRGEELWADHLAKRLVVVDEATGRRALALMRRFDLTIRQAADRLGVSHLKLKGRIGTIRARERSNAGADHD